MNYAYIENDEIEPKSIIGCMLILDKKYCYYITNDSLINGELITNMGGWTVDQSAYGYNYKNLDLNLGDNKLIQDYIKYKLNF